MIVVVVAAAVAWCGGIEHSDKVKVLSMAGAKYEPVVATVAVASEAAAAAAAEASEDAVLAQAGVPGGEVSVGDSDTADSLHRHHLLLHLCEGRHPRSVEGVVIALTGDHPDRPGCVAKDRPKGSMSVLPLVYPLRRHCYRRYYSNYARRFHVRHGVLHVHVVRRREKPPQSQKSPSTIQDLRLPKKKMTIRDHLRRCRRRHCLER